MHPFKVQVKLFSHRPTNVDDYVPVFHRWIRENVLGELLIDVVDYTHVPDGPAVVLIGHESDYSLDRTGGKLGFLYVNKRAPELKFPEALRRLFRAAALLESETVPGDRVSFRTDELVIRVADRLHAPNDEHTHQRLEPELRAGLAEVYGARSIELSRFGTNKELFAVTARIAEAPSLADLAGSGSVRPS